MMPSPAFAPSFPVPPPPGAYPASWTSPGRPAPPLSSAPAQAQQQPARPVIRAQAPDESSPAPRPARPESRPAPLRIPSPEQLGVTAGAPVAPDSPDWSTVHRRLDLLGATCLHLEKLPQGGCRFTCLLPTSQPDRHHHIEAQAASEAEAVRLALQKAEQWAGPGR